MLLCKNVLVVFRRFRCSTKYFSMENLLPPKEIRGMKILNKDLILRNVQVPCVVVSVNNLKEVLKRIKPYLLKVRNLKPVRIRDDKSKELLLNPVIVSNYEDINSEVRNALSNFGDVIHFEFVNIKLTYENWNSSDILSIIIPKEIGAVSGYSIIGHIIHLNLKSELYEYKTIIGQILLEKISQAKCVVNKVNNIESEFRTFKLELLAGVDDYIVQVIENKCVYKFDFSKVYWNPRLSTEHQRIVDSLKSGDFLFDAFAGVGPFTIPAAKKGVKVFANDLNSEAVRYLKENLRLNKVEQSVVITEKDAADFIRDDFKGHFLKLKPGDYNVLITMNLPSLAANFLPCFKGIFNSDDLTTIEALPIPQVHVYCFIKNEEDPYSAAKKLVTDHLCMDLENEIRSVSSVRNVAPNKEMMRVVILLTPRILISQKRDLSPPIDDKLLFTPVLKKPNISFISQDKEGVQNERTEEEQSF